MSTVQHLGPCFLTVTAVVLGACGSVDSEEIEFTDAAAQGLDASVSVDAADTSGIDAEPLGPAHQVFTSTISFGANFGGLAGADAECQTRADRGGLAGQWKAIMVDTNTTLEDHLVVRGPVMSRTGTLLAATPADFFAGNLLGPNLGTETNAVHPNPTVAWIGHPDLNCEDWATESGRVNGANTFVSDQSWNDFDSNTPCSAQLPIQCIEQFE